MNDAQRRFVDDMGQMMVAWGLPRTTGRVYGYLLLRPKPATLDEIVRDLAVAKSGASVATRQLIGSGLARSFGEPRSRRLRYDALYELDAMIAARNAQTMAFFRALHAGVKVASSPAVRRKILAMTGDLERTYAGALRHVRPAQRRKAT